MAPRGGPWRASGPVTLGSVADRQPGQASGEQTIAGDRMLRRVVYAYLVSVVRGWRRSRSSDCTKVCGEHHGSAVATA